MTKPIDLRSDTVTKPSGGMRQAMAEAEVGDDVHGEDPTVNKLQQRVAAMLGKEAALFVPSGTMANQIALFVHMRPGDEVILERGSHVFYYEAGGMTALGGVHPYVLDGIRGIIEAEQVEESIRFSDVHLPPTRLIWVENTHNRGGGTVFPLEKIKAIRNVSLNYSIPVHMDGARLFNACVAADVPPDEYARHVDTLNFCFSKGLGAPVGSIIAGTSDAITRAHRYRKMLGGGMRQAGILAAAALYALDHNIERLAEDHKNAKRLAAALAELDGVRIVNEPVETNLLYFDVSRSGMNTLEIKNESAEAGLLVDPISFTVMRAVTHLGVSTDDIERAVEVFRNIFARSK